MKNLFYILLISILSTLNANEKIITLANETTWAPHYGKELNNGGYTTEIISEAMKRVGYDIKIKWLPWNRAVTLATKGIYDGLGACYYNDKRAKNFVYSNTIGDTKTVFFKLKKTKINYKSLKDLKDFKIGTSTGYAYPKIFTDAKFLKTINSPRLEINIKKLLKNRIDLVIGSKKVMQHYLNTKFPNDKDKIEILEPSVDSMPLYVAFSKKSKNYKQKVKDFNIGLDIIKKDGTFEKILKKHGF
jgi:polar amino acid transport system substrate-binding protein